MIELPLAAPPDVVNVGAGIHGVRSLRDVFRLPDLWQLHLYSYSADLTVDGVDVNLHRDEVVTDLEVHRHRSDQ